MPKPTTAPISVELLPNDTIPTLDLSDLITRVTAIESRLNCTCSNNLRVTKDTHEQWCPSFIPPATRTRDCYNCGNQGVVPNHAMSSLATEFSICPVCLGKGKVEEQWESGRLTWPKNPVGSE